MSATRPTLEDLRKIPFPSGGGMFYFVDDKQFLYFRIENKSDLKQKIEVAKRSGKRVNMYPMQLSVAYMRKGLTEQNVGAFYEQKIMRFNMSSEDFVKEYLDGNPIGVKHNKSKGTMKGEEFWVSKYVFYDGTEANFRIFRV